MFVVTKHIYNNKEYSPESVRIRSLFLSLSLSLYIYIYIYIYIYVCVCVCVCGFIEPDLKYQMILS